MPLGVPRIYSYRRGMEITKCQTLVTYFLCWRARGGVVPVSTPLAPTAGQRVTPWQDKYCKKGVCDTGGGGPGALP